MLSLKDLKRFVKTSDVTFLDLSTCTDFAGLEEFSNIQELKVSNSKLGVMPAFDSLRKLEKLNLSHNNLKVVPAFPRVLRICNLSHNALTTIFIGKLRNLTELNISNNRILTLEPLSSLRSLTYLYCSHNLVTNLQPLANLPIVEIDISHNQISTFSVFSVIISSIQVVKLTGNPCVQQTSTIFHNFTQHAENLYSKIPLKISESKLLKNFIQTKIIKLSKSTIIEKISAQLSVLKGKNTTLSKKVKKIEERAGIFVPGRMQEVEQMSYEDWRSGLLRYNFLKELYSTGKLLKIQPRSLRQTSKKQTRRYL